MSSQKVIAAPAEVSREDHARKIAAIEEEMNHSLKKILVGVRRWMARNVEWSLRRTWELGRTLHRVQNNESRYERHAVDRLSKVLGIDRSTLDKAIRFFVFFPEEKLEHLLSLKMVTSGSTVSFQHIDKLTTIEDENRRDRMLLRCVEEQWTPAELAYNIQVLYRQELGQTRKPHAGGRPVAIPRNILQLTGNYNKVTGTLTRNDDLMYSDPLVNFLRFVDELPADKVTPELIAQLDTCLDNTDEAMTVLVRVKPQLMEAKARAERKMNAQAQVQGVADAEVLSAKPAEGGDGQPKRLGHRGSKAS